MFTIEWGEKWKIWLKSDVMFVHGSGLGWTEAHKFCRWYICSQARSLSLLHYMIPPPPSQYEQDLLCELWDSADIGYAENSWISLYRIWVLGWNWCFRRIYGEIRQAFLPLLSLPAASPHCHHFLSLYLPSVHRAHLIDRPKIQFNDLPACL